MVRRRNRASIGLEGIYRKLMLRYLHGALPIILVNEFPKSGASWIAQLLSAVVGLPFPRQRFPSLRSAIFHGHYLSVAGRGPTVVVWRDPRDIVVSFYHYALFQNERNHPSFVARYRKALGECEYGDVRGNLPHFIRLLFESPVSPSFSFNQFFEQWWNSRRVIHCMYECFLADPSGSLASVVNALGYDCEEERIAAAVEEYSFQKQSGRAVGSEDKNSYLRKGVRGDWENYFSSESKDVFKSFIGSRLKQMGYVSDDNW